MKAVILAAGVGKRLWPVTKERPKCLIEIGGRTLLSRLLDSLQEVGVTHVIIVVGHLKEKIIDAIGERYKTLGVSYIVNNQHTKGSILSLWMARDELNDNLLIMDADVLFPPLLLLRLVRSPHANCLLLDETSQSHGEEMMVTVRHGRVTNITRHPSGEFDCAGEGVGFLKVSKEAAPLLKEALTHLIAEGKDEAEYEDALALFLQKVEVGYERVGGLPWTEIDFADDIIRAEREILPRLSPLRFPRAIEKFLSSRLSREETLDGFLDRHLNRKVSPFFTLLFIKIGISPNGITLLSFAIGLLSALFFTGGYQSSLIGALLFQVSSIVDCCDGEAARLTFRQSRIGKWLDPICDNIVHVLIFLAIARSTYPHPHDRRLLYLIGGLILSGILLSTLLVFSLLWRTHKTDGEKRIARIIGTIATRDFSAVLLICALLGQITVFLWIATIGLQIFWITLLFLTVRTNPHT